MGLVLNLLAHLLLKRAPAVGAAAYIEYVVLAYTALATFWFTMNTLIPTLRPDHAAGGRRGGGEQLTPAQVTQRNYLAIGAGLLQCCIVWWLAWSSG